MAKTAEKCRKVRKVTDNSSRTQIIWNRLIPASAVLLLAISLLPLLKLAAIDVATGDDYGYGAVTRAAWLGSHSLIQVFYTAAQEVRKVYGSWQGTWFTVFLFTLNPEVFHPHSYWIVPCTMLFLQIATAFLFAHHFLVVRGKFTNACWITVSSLMMLAQIQCIPYIKTSVFWYVGTIHYILPFSMVLVVIVCADRLLERFKVQDFIILLVNQTLLGGGNYQAALLAPLTILVIVFIRWMKKREKCTFCLKKVQIRKYLTDKKIYAIAIPFIMELTGLLISVKSPGNKNRGGTGFGFGMKRAADAIVHSFTEAFMQMLDYWLHKTFVVLILLLVVWAAWQTLRKQKMCSRIFIQPVLFILLMCCLNASVHTPAIYAAVGVSGGVDNTNFMVAMMTSAASLINLAGWMAERAEDISSRWHARIYFIEKYRKAVGIIVVCLMCTLFLLGRHSIKTMTDYVCYTYIQSGQAEDYRQQMQQQYALLSDDAVKDPVIPLVNDEQGPLMQMPVTMDANAWSNRVTADFYGKRTVTGMDRNLWISRHQK